jgi:hypothetical protein
MILLIIGPVTMRGEVLDTAYLKMHEINVILLIFTSESKNQVIGRIHLA